MNNPADIVTILCAEFDDKYKPLTRAEFWMIYHRCGDSVEAVAENPDERIVELMERQGAIAFGIEKLEQMGVKILTFVDEDFPSPLRDKLGDFCPPLLYCCGNPDILQQKFVGYVGSRSIGEEDVNWTKQRLKHNLEDGFGIVTGGAKRIDIVATQYALGRSSPVAVFLPNSLKENLKDSFIRKHIYDEDLMLMSHV